MRSTLSLIRREFSAYFYSPIAYVVLAVFLAVTGHLFYLSLELLTARGPRGISYPMEMFVRNERSAYYRQWRIVNKAIHEAPRSNGGGRFRVLSGSLRVPSI